MKRIIIEHGKETLIVSVYDNKKQLSVSGMSRGGIGTFLERTIQRYKKKYDISDNNVYVYSPNLFKGWLTKVCDRKFADYMYHYYTFKSIYSFISFKEIINDDYISWALENKKFTKCGYVSTSLKTIKEYFHFSNCSNATTKKQLYLTASEHKGRKRVFDIKPIHLIIDNKITAIA